MAHLTNEHKQLNIAVLTISDTRTKDTDKGGQKVCEKLVQAGHHILQYDIVKDEKLEIEAQVVQYLQNENIQAIITTGGTGLAKRDVTIEALEPLYDKKIDGFGELFRYLSFVEDVGSKALLSRGSAGVIGEQVLFALPGSVKAVELAMTRLIIPELNHIVNEITKA